jgi:N-acetylglucosamine-6-phosphate deacetylase
LAKSWDEALARRLPPGWTVAPGFVDLQVNGFAGAEVGDDPDQIAAVARMLPSVGVTAFCPTLVTRSDTAYRRAARALASTPWPAAGARNLGVHLEGPFLNPARAGAHAAGRMRLPTREGVQRLTEMFTPHIVTLAPDVRGALDAVAWLTAKGVVVGCGHTDATANQARAALDAGARLLTHTFNAMPGMTAREPGPVGAFLAHPEAMISLIADGAHVSPELCTLVARVAGNRLVLVSDATAATGAPAGRYPLGERTITSDGKEVTIGGRLAGAMAPLWRGVANLVGWGVPRQATLAAASRNPLRLVNARANAGDRVVLDEDLVPRLTLVGGCVAFVDPTVPFDVPEMGMPFRS